MKINLEVIHSCTIKRRKPWPRISWIGKDKEKLFLLDSQTQRISLIDPKNGKTKRKVSKLSSVIKTIVSFNISDDGGYFVGILVTGDLILWNKDSDSVRNIIGRKEFALRLGFHCPSVFVSNDSKKIILITSRNKVFIWESDRYDEDKNGKSEGNWSDIIASKDIKTVEDNKELVLDTQFVQNQYDGTSATCCFVFNYENKSIINVLKIKWLSESEIISQYQCRFVTLWICYQPTYQLNITCLDTRGAYAIKLSHSAEILAIASNQKYIEKTSLVYMSVSNGAIHKINLKNFGLNSEAKGRHYWIQEIKWLFNDLYIACITKHGAVFLASRLGQPLIIHAFGKEINMGPALYLSIHPLIIIRGKSDTSNNQSSGDASLNSAIETENHLRQRYSITNHPNLPIFLCSDGYLLCILKLESAYSTQSRLMREIMHETISLLNSSSQTLTNKEYSLKNPLERFDNKIINDDFPDWCLEINQTSMQSNNSDSGLENEDKKRADSFGTKIAEGKIIFSYLPQVLPISHQFIDTNSLSNKMEAAYEYLQTSWTLLVSTNKSDANKNTHEYDQTAKAIQQLFAHFSHLFLMLDSENLNEFQSYKIEFKENDKDYKLKVINDLFIRMLKFLNFDFASKYNPNSHMIVYIPLFVEKFIQSLLKHDSWSPVNESKTSLLSLVYSLLNASETILKQIYNLKNGKKCTIITDSILAQKGLISDLKLEDPKYLGDSVQQENVLSIQKKSNFYETVEFSDLIFEKCWIFLMQNCDEYRNRIQLLGQLNRKPLKDLNLLIILTEKRLLRYPSVFNQVNTKIQLNSIQKNKSVYKINKADFIYLAYGNLDQAVDEWISELNEIFNKLGSAKKHKHLYSRNYISKSIKIAHKIFYACLANFKLKKLILFINNYFNDSNEEHSPFNLQLNSFKYIKPGKQLQKTQIAIVSLLKSLARFMALYFINSRPIFIDSVTDPLVMPSLIHQSSAKVEISKQKLTNCINNQTELYSESIYFKQIEFDKLNLATFFTADKCLELLIVTGLYDEAIYFLNLINDWKNSYLITSIFKESNNSDILNMIEQVPYDMQPENLLSTKLCSLLSIDNNNFKIMDKQHLDSIGLVLKELLLCSVMTKTNIIESILNTMMESFIFYTNQLCSSNIIVSDEFYLPSPPVYCIPMDSYKESNSYLLDFNHESNLRIKLYSICKCIILLLSSSNIHTPLIKWYLQQLTQSSQDMKQKFGINNNFQLNLTLKNLLTSIRYQKHGPIPENILQIFRDLCAVLFFLDVRDKFSLVLRQYSRHFILNQELNYEESSNNKQVLLMCFKIIDYGNLLLSYGKFVRFQFMDIKDIILSTVIRLTKFNQNLKDLNLEFKLANCITKNQINEMDFDSESFNSKLERLINDWKLIPARIDDQISMADVYEHQIHLLSSNSKLVHIYGLGEEALNEVYAKKQIRKLSVVGGYEFERSQFCSDFLELFFKLGFDLTEDWEALIQSVNRTPLLLEFYDIIRSEQLRSIDFVDKKYIITQSNLDLSQLYFKPSNEIRRRRSVLANSTKEETKSFKQNGLFRSYSIVLNNTTESDSVIKNDNTTLKKSVSFSALNAQDDNCLTNLNDNHKEFRSEENPLKVFDFGSKYAPISNLSIWLIKWSIKFQKIIITHKMSDSFSNNNDQNVTLKLNSINANSLTGCYYFADKNNLDHSSLIKLKKQLVNKQSKNDVDDDFTQISNSINAKQTIKQEEIANETSTSTSLDISSLTDKTLTQITQPKLDVPKPRSRSPRKNVYSSMNQSIGPNKISEYTQATEMNLTQDTSDFYNLKEQSKMSIKPPFSTQTSQQSDSSELNKSLDKKSMADALELLQFKNSSSRRASLSPSRSPSKEQSSSFVINKSFNKTKEFFPEPVQMLNIVEPQSTSNTIPEIIRNELKKVLQMQYDTGMSFLNNGASYNPPKKYNNQDIEQHLETILNQKQLQDPNVGPIDLIIETRFKTVDAKTGLPNSTTVITPKNQGYFLKTFEPKYQVKSNLIKIPLLNIKNEIDSTREFTPRVHLPLVGQNLNESKKFESRGKEFKLLEFKSLKTHKQKGLLHLEQQNNDKEINKHIRNFIEKTSKTKNYKDFNFLKLNHEPTKESIQQSVIKSDQFENILPISKLKESNTEKLKQKSQKKQEEPVKLTQQTQVDIANYDGYILAPNIFQEKLDNKENNHESSASLHFKSVQHLRDAEQQIETKKIHKDNFTNTESLKNGDPIAPDILFKMKFDSKRKDRQINHHEDDEPPKDYVNVVDLDPGTVDDILKMIEMEQNKRLGKFVPLKLKQKSFNDVADNLNKTLTEESNLNGDKLTENLLKDEETHKDDWKQTDELMHRQIKETEEVGQNISKQRMINELKFIDEKIKLMNQMADNMNADYQHYGRILNTVQDLSNQHVTVTDQYQEEQLRFEKEQLNNKRKKEKLKFYRNSEAHDQINDLKSKSLKSELNAIYNETQLSDLSSNEERRLEKLLKNDLFDQTNESDLENTSNSLTNILKDVFSNLNIDTIDDLDPDKIDQMIEQSNKPVNNKKLDHLSLKRTPSKQSSKSIKISINEPPSKLKSNFEKRQTSPIVNKEKFKSQQRDTLQNNFSLKREEDAKELLRDIIIDNYQFEAESNRIHSARSQQKSPTSSAKLKKEPTTVPKLHLEFRNLEAFSVDLQKSEKNLKNEKPSLMTRTILALEKRELSRKNETDRLLKGLEKRATIVTEKIEKKNTQKLIKSFTNYVHLQEPSKLRDHPDHAFLTYGEQLKKHQNKSQVHSMNSINQVYKIYGTKRVPGLYKNYTKQTPRKTKTYTQILKDLKPAQSQIVQQKKTIKTSFKNSQQQRRFKPYNKSVDKDKIEDLSSWSLDDKLKNIIYDDHKTSKRVTYKEADQDTLADMDGDYLNDLLEDGKANDKIYQNLLKDLSVLNDNDNDSYLSQVNLNDLKNISLSSESAISSFIDWDQIDQIIGIK